MKQFKYFLLISISLSYACSKNDNTIPEEKPDYSFETVVDSSFYCRVQFGDSIRIFPYLISHAGFEITSQNDSVIFGCSFTYVDTVNDIVENFTIGISKTFKKSELIYSEDTLTKEEFLSIYSQNNIPFSTFDRNYFQNIDWIMTPGAYIYYKDIWELWKTSYTAIHLEQDSIAGFYSNSQFSITKLQILDDSHIVIEGTFDVNIFNWFSQNKRFSKGYFKSFIKNDY